MTEAIAAFLNGWDPQSPSALGALALLACIGAIAFIPRTPTFIAAGLVFGMIAAPIVLVAATFGGVAAFLATRTVLTARVRAYVERRKQLHAIVRAIDAHGWRLLALFRFWSPVPSTVQNYVFALTPMSLPTFFWVSLLFGAPQGVVYTYIGVVGGEALRSGALSTMTTVAAGVALIAFLGLTYLVARRVRRELTASDGQAAP